MAAQWVGKFSHRISMLAVAAQGVMYAKEHPTHIILADFGRFLEGLASSLKEVQKELEGVAEVEGSEAMEAEVTAVEQLVIAQKAQSEFVSLLSTPLLLAALQSCREVLSKGIESIVSGSGSAVVKLQIARRKQSPKNAVVEALGALTEESPVVICREAAAQVAECVGKSIHDPAFAVQFADAKRDVAKMSGDHATQLASSIDALERGFGFQNAGVEAKTRQVLAPLPSFLCPLTKQVMKDPMQIASGQTFEKSAITQWFKDGKTTSPVTGQRLRNTRLTPDHALRLSITEWKERNYNLRLDNAESCLRSFQPMEQARGACDIKILCEEDAINKYSVASRKLIPQLIRLADTPNIPATLREFYFNALAALAVDHQENQKTLVFEGAIDVLVRCLRNREEAEPAINLLKILSTTPSIAEIIGLKPDAVLLLVTFLGHESESLVVAVKAVLVNLPTDDENIVVMAEANLMKPLVTRLVEGGKESKIVMARTLGRLKHMPDSSRCLASTRDTITTLISMTNSDDEEEMDAAVQALKNLSTVPSVGILIAKCSGLEVLIRLLSTSKQTSKNQPKVGASYIVANVLRAVGNEWPATSDDKEADIDSYLEPIFILVSSSTKPPTSPAVQSHLLQGLLGLVEGKDTGRVVRIIMLRRNAFSLLTSHFRDKHPETRRDSLKLFSALSRKHGEEAWSAIKIHSGTLRLLVDMLKAEPEMISEPEKVAAVRIIAHLPVEDEALTASLRDYEMVPLLVKYLSSSNHNLEEAAMGALVRFTKSLQTQEQLAQMGVIPSFVNLLDSRKHQTKIDAAKALTNFARSSPSLVRPVAPAACWQCFAPAPVTCKLHGGLCSVESTFCLLAADAVEPLLAVVADHQPANKKATEAALEALFALVADDHHCERACYVIHHAGGVPIILGNLPNCTPRAQELSIDLCERFSRTPELLDAFGATAQMLIITVAQNAAVPRTRGPANRILQKLELLGSLAGSQTQYVSTSTASAAGRSRRSS